MNSEPINAAPLNDPGADAPTPAPTVVFRKSLSPIGGQVGRRQPSEAGTP